MALYSFESLRSYLKLRDRRIVADSSYLYRLSDTTDPRHNLVLNFHQRVRPINGKFFINVVIRQEFLREIRRVQMIDTMLYLVNKYPGRFRTRYVTSANKKNLRRPETQHLVITGNRPLTAEHLKECYDDLFKEHLRKGDVQMLNSNWIGNVDSYYQAQEQSMQMNYKSFGGTMDWTKLNNLMQATGMAPTDAMITNFALVMGAAIVTTDLDYMQVANITDVFMPYSLARQAKGIYDRNLD